MIYFIVAILLLFLGNIFREYRWEMFISTYEKPKRRILFKSMSIGSFINYFIPYKLGDIFRGIYSGKKLKNGMSCSFATIIIERYIDIISVGIIFMLLYIFKVDSYTSLTSIIYYVTTGIILLIFSIVCIKYSGFTKKIIQKISAIFNSKIELKLLTFTYFFISIFKDVYKKMNKIKLLTITILIWIFYLFSYYMFALFISNNIKFVSNVTIFNLLFSNNNFILSTLQLGKTIRIADFNFYLFIYMIVPILIMYISSSAIKDSKYNEASYRKFVPHLNENDRLNFLELYFSGLSRDYFQNYMKINSNISIIQDYSAGSNATTMLCKNEFGTFYRKYIFGESSSKLKDQIEWIKKNQTILPLPNIIRDDYHVGSYCYYDMPYNNLAITCFNYVHSMPVNDSWKIIRSTLNVLKDKLYIKDLRFSDEDSINKYIKTKVLKNIDKIENYKAVKQLFKYNNIIINGKKYYNLQYLKKYLDYQHLYKIFSNDKYSIIHGDLTIENIVCILNKKKENFYLIDPNTGNIHDSSFLDYAKLLQSLHGGYEFLMKNQSVEINNNNITYLNVKSSAYKELYFEYDKYLNKTFNYEEVKSIYYHEIIHWLRLLPYKFEKNPDTAMVFYAGFIIVLNEVIEKYEKE